MTSTHTLVREEYLQYGSVSKADFMSHTQWFMDKSNKHAWARCRREGGIDITSRGTTAMVRGDQVEITVYLEAYLEV